MKITLFVLLLTVSSVFAKSTYSQNTKLTLHLENATLQQVFDEIKKNSEFIIFYKDDQVNLNHQSNIHVEDALVDQILIQAFEGTNLGYRIIDRQIVVFAIKPVDTPATGGSETTAEQKREFSGTVRDSNGLPLPGATVYVKGSTMGTTTDNSGHYRISIPLDAKILIFSFVGFKTQEVKIGIQNTIDVNLTEEAIGLNEVVAIGYGTIKREAFTGSVSSVSAKQVRDIPINSAAAALAGRLAGVQVTGSEGSPDAQVQIRVRGGGSITQDNSPLYVVDGIIVANALSILSPQDIESVDVLKDASTTAIYGARGSNGVVLITTKGGIKGKSTVTYNGFIGFQKVQRTLSVLDPYDYVLYQYERSRGDSYKEGTFLSNFGSWNELSMYKEAPFVDWQNQIFGRSGFMQTHNVSITGGGDKTQFSLSLTDNENEAVMEGSDYSRKLVNFKLTHEVSSKFKTGFNVRFNNQIVNGAGVSNPGTSNSNSLRLSVLYTPFLAPNQTLESFNQQLFDQTVGSNGLFLANPLLLIRAQYLKSLQSSFGLSGYADYIFSKFLTFRTTVGYDTNRDESDKFDDSMTSNSRIYGSSLPIATLNIYSSQTLSNSNVFTFTNRKFAGSFNKNNPFDIILGQETYASQEGYYNIVQKYFPKGTSAEKAFGSLNLASPPVGSQQLSPTSNKDMKHILSFFTRVNFSHKNKYLATFSLRADGSSVFAPGLQWGYFPAGSVGWKISDEKFMEKLKSSISNVKLRLNYGESGNNRIQSFLYLTQFNTRDNYYGLQNQLASAYGPIGLANANLTWETTISRNAGLDFSLFKNRVQFNLDYYRNKTKNLLISVPVPTTAGFTNQIQNVGSTSNIGFEAQISSSIINKKDFNWSANFNISFNQNKILSLGKQKFYMQSSNWFNSNADYIVKVGEPVGSMYGLVNDGFYKIDDFDYNTTTHAYTLKASVPNGFTVSGVAPQPGIVKYKDLNADGIVDSKDQQIIGNANPKFFGGLNQQLVYKNFDFSLFVNFVYGNDVENNNKLEFSSGYVLNANLLSTAKNRWRTVNDNGIVVTDPVELASMNKNATQWIPSTSINGYYPQSWAIEKGSFIRINNITFGYTLPGPITRAVKMQKLRVYCTLNNVALITGYSGYDPEVSTRRSTPVTPGVDYSAYPRSASYIFGLNVTF